MRGFLVDSLVFSRNNICCAISYLFVHRYRGRAYPFQKVRTRERQHCCSQTLLINASNSSAFAGVSVRFGSIVDEDSASSDNSAASVGNTTGSFPIG